MNNVNLIFLFITFLFSSCTVIVPAFIWTTSEKVTHEEVMDTYKNKKDVIRNFGVPTSKVFESGVEIWTYKNASNNNNKIIEGTIEFQFEENDKVSSWRTAEHENFGNITDRTKKTYFGYLIGGTIDLIVLFVIGFSAI